VRALLISILGMVIIITGWCIFVQYSDESIHKLMNSIEEEILINVRDKDWDKAADQFDLLSKRWHDQKKVYSFFFNSTDINNTDYSIARAKHYIYTQNASLASGELNCIKEQLGFMHSNELITLDNIF
jgi:hypothetical protein